MIERQTKSTPSGREPGSADQLYMVSVNNDICSQSDMKLVPLTEVINRIKKGTYKDAIREIRFKAAQGRPEEVSTRKKALPYFVYGVVKGARKADHVEQANGIIFDFDHVAEIEDLKNQAATRIPGAKYLFRSPNDGVKVMIAFNEPVRDMNSYKLIWDAMAQEAENAVGIKPDATPDPCRACFMSWDENLLITDNSPLDVGELLEALQRWAKEDREQKVPAGDAASPDTGIPDEEIEVDDPMEYNVQLAVEHLCTQKIAYNNWMKVGMALRNHFGERGKKYWDKFLHNPHYPQETQANLDKLWEGFDKYSSVNIGSLFWVAKYYGWENVVALSGPAPTLEDYPELQELFCPKEDVALDPDKLPEELQNYLAIMNRITDSSQGAKLTAILPVIAAAIGNRIGMVNAGATHFCNIWAVIIGPSSISRKSTVIKQAQKCLSFAHAKLKGLKPQKINEQSIEIQNVTQARLLNLLALNPNRLIVQTEFGAWMKEMNKNYNQGMKAEITDMFDGNDKSIAKMDVNEYIQKPAFSIVGGTTEEWFMSELKESADQRGGFLQRLLVCFYRDIDVSKLNFDLRSNPEADHDLQRWGSRLEVLNALNGTHYLRLGEDAVKFRNEVYAEKMRELALKGNDPLISYSTRIYDNYFFRFSIALHAIKHYRDIGEANENCRLAGYFKNVRIDLQTAREAMYLCDFYFENTKPFLTDLWEAGKLENEKKVVNVMRSYGLEEVPHHKLLSASRMTGHEFRRAMDSLVERKAIFCTERRHYNQRIARYYRLNPVLV